MTMDKAQGQPQDNLSRDYAGASVPNRIGYRFQELDPGANIYVQRDDILTIVAMSSINNEQVTIAGRLLIPGRDDGPTQPDPTTQNNPLGNSPFGEVIVINQTFKLGSQYTPVTNTVNLAEGYLLSLAVNCLFGRTRGETFVRVFLGRGISSALQPALLMIADYCTQTSPIGWPGAQILSPVSGRGNIRGLTVVVGLGAEINVAPTTKTRIRILSIGAILVTSAVAGNRQIQFVLVDVTSGFRMGTYPVNANVPASTTARVTAGPGANPSALIGTDVTASLPDDIILAVNANNNLNLNTATLSIDAGDGYSAVELLVEEWLDF